MSTTQPETTMHDLLEQIRERHSALAPVAPAELNRPQSPALAAYLGAQGVLPDVAGELAGSVSGLSATPDCLESQLECLEIVLRNRWRSCPGGNAPAGTHIFVGPHGSGKTTVLSKWLAQTVLLAEQTARVFRLDGASANTAECLSVYGEVLDVPVLRSFPAHETLDPVDVTFIDLPGFNPEDQSALQDLSSRIAALSTNRGQCQVHLVLNAAYETSLLLSQVHACASLGVTDLILSHLDEEMRWGKLINVLWRTDLAISWLAAGQNVPGGLIEARPSHLVPRVGLDKVRHRPISRAA